MTLQKLIEDQLSAIRTANKNLTRKTLGPEDLTRPTEKIQDRISRIDAKIEALTRQRDETVRRLDAAIAEEKKLRDRLGKNLSTITTRLPDDEEGGDTTRRTTTAPGTTGTDRTATTKPADTEATGTPAPRKKARPKYR